VPERILILHQEVGADASEDEKDTLAQAAFTAESLEGEGFRTEMLAIGLDLENARNRLLSIAPEVVFNMVESLDGRGEFIHFAAGLLESLGLPYTGTSPEALFLTSHKLLAKATMRRAGIPTPDWFTLDDRGRPDRPPVFPCLRKSVWEHASIGMDDSALIDSEKALASGAAGAAGPVFYERYIEGREFNLSLMEDAGKVRPLVPVEILFIDYPEGKPKIVGYRAKWESDSLEYKNTRHGFDFPAADAPLLEELTAIAVRCWSEFGLSGYARVDFRVDDRNRPWVLEINGNPCLTPDAGFYINALRSGYTRGSLFSTIVDAARNRSRKGAPQS
jgi:D-alanine-D-alanine ligase